MATVRNHPFSKPELKILLHWIKEREAIRQRKEAQLPQTKWTNDPILRRFRFCNVNRNDDTVTRWIFGNWLLPHAGMPDLWFALVVARLLNLPSSLAAVQPALFNRADKVMWDPDGFVTILKALREEGNIFNAAYIVSTNGVSMDKVQYLADRVLNPLWVARKDAAGAMHTLDGFHKWLMSFDGLGSFMAAQVIGDLKYDPASRLANAPDWHHWAASGPGSRRGLHRLYGRDFTKGYPEHMWRSDFGELYDYLQDGIQTERLDVGATAEVLTGQNLQNCLCEFDKYRRVQNGEGTPKQIYKPK